MTVKIFGRLTPLQGHMLGLIGYTVSRQSGSFPTYWAGRMKNILQARQRLIECTGKDFGYDCKKWHTFLSAHHSDEYTHPHAFAAVAQAVAAVQKDNIHLRIVNHINNAEQSIPPAESKRLRKKVKRLIEKYNQPNPPGLVPSARTDEGLLELWYWAVWWDLENVLAGFALPICAFADELFGKADLQAHLLSLAEQAEAQLHTTASARFLTAAAKLEPDKDSRFNLYQRAMAAYTDSGHWGGEAYCAHQLAGLHRYWHQFNEADQMYMRAFKLWERNNHQKAMGISLLHLGETLERAGKYTAACQLYFRAKKLLRNHITYITSRDALTKVSGDHQVSPQDYETDQSASELVAAYFDGHLVKD
jgi:tetratricopeptide (TPR) repeat protein